MAAGPSSAGARYNTPSGLRSRPLYRALDGKAPQLVQMMIFAAKAVQSTTREDFRHVTAPIGLQISTVPTISAAAEGLPNPLTNKSSRAMQTGIGP